MRFCSTIPAAASVVLSGLVASPAWSLAITCGTPERTATLESAEACVTGLGNPQAGDILAAFPADAWSQQGELTGNGTNGFLSATLIAGSWGSSPIAGTWAISADFWSTFTEAVLSIHVGNGNGDPDFFAWLITPNATSGTWTYSDLDGQGGGLSNVKLWGRGTAVGVPEPGTLLLLGAGLVGAALARRRPKGVGR